MKLEKVVTRPKIGLWVFLFIVGLAVAGVMATSYNIEVVKHVNFESVPWLKIILGSLGFISIISALILFFYRLLREMKVSQIQADFLDRISHELRTPLATLTLVSDLLKNETNSPAEIAQLWKSHGLELTRLKSDVELLLQAARLRETKLRAELKVLDLENWLSEKWESFQDLLGTGAILSRQGSKLDGSVQIDPVLFELIIRNFLDNARKFSLGKPVVQIRTEKTETGWFKKKGWRLSIVDQGLGFKPQNQNYLFRRFSRLPQRANDKSVAIPGTGLGLYLSASASRAMGITLRGVSLGEGKGAEFSLEGDFKS